MKIGVRGLACHRRRASVIQTPGRHPIWCRLKRIHTNSAKAQECRNGNFRLSTNSGCFSLSRRPLPASRRVVLCLLPVASSSACFSSRRPLLAFRHVVLCLLLPILRSWILLVLHLQMALLHLLCPFLHC